MKKYILIAFAITLQLTTALATIKSSQLISNQQVNDLVLLGRIWGLLKYHHPAIIKGTYDWDEELIKVLPAYRNSKNTSERNQLLLKWVSSFGNVQDSKTIPDSLLTNVKLKPDYGWISKSNLMPQLADLLTAISHYSGTEDQHYVKFMAEDDIVLPSFVNEAAYAQMAYPADEYRLLAVYRYWNIIEYWYPYKYLAGVKWEDSLRPFIKEALAADDALGYTRFVQKMVGTIQDSHAVVSSRQTEELKGRWVMPFTVKFMDGKAVVTSNSKDLPAGVAIKTGDVIEAIGGKSVTKIIADERAYLSASNRAVVLREIARMITRSTDSVADLTIINSQGKKYPLRVKNSHYTLNASALYDFPYQKDSSCFVLPSGVIYLNAGKFKDSQVAWIKQHLPAAKGLVLDARQYPRTGAGALINLLQTLLIADKGAMSKFSTAVKGYPGLFRFAKPFEIGKANAGYYRGKVAVVVNEETQSTSEFLTMAYQLVPGMKVVGSTTAGADGNVSYPFALPGGFTTMITGLGVYYPDGRETQQVGIPIDVKVKQTVAGFRNHKDELLDKAVETLSK